jgi:hypothetical protein
VVFELVQSSPYAQELLHPERPVKALALLKGGSVRACTEAEVERLRCARYDLRSSGS